MKRGKVNRSIGDRGEQIAARYLEQQGFRILERNFRYERGEIDLVAEEGDELVFVEVKTRRSRSFGDPEESVDEAKEEQIRDTAEGYLVLRGVGERIYRFDIVAVLLEGETPEIHHIRDAF